MLQKFCGQTSGISRIQFEPLAHSLWGVAETVAQEVALISRSWGSGRSPALCWGWGAGCAQLCHFSRPTPSPDRQLACPIWAASLCFPEERLRQFGPAQGIWGEDLLVLSKHLVCCGRMQSPKKESPQEALSKAARIFSTFGNCLVGREAC